MSSPILYVWYCCQCRSMCSKSLQPSCWSCDHVSCGACLVPQAPDLGGSSRVLDLKESRPSKEDKKAISDRPRKTFRPLLRETSVRQSADPQRDIDPFDEFIQLPDELEHTDPSGALHSAWKPRDFREILNSDRQFSLLIQIGLQRNTTTFPSALEACIRSFGHDLTQCATTKDEMCASKDLYDEAFAVVQSLTRQAFPALKGAEVGNFKPGHDELHTTLISSSDKSSDQSITPEDQEKTSSVRRFILGSSSFQRLLAEIDWSIDDLFEKEPLFLDYQQERSKSAKWLSAMSSLTTLLEPRRKPGSVRVRWKCSCGANMWDDFTSRDERDVRLLTARLNRLFATFSGPDGNDSRSHPARTWSGWSQGLRLLFIDVWTNLERIKKSLYRRPCTSKETLPTTKPDQGSRSPFFLTCVDTGQYLPISQALPKLFESSCDDVPNDQEYFRMLRRTYESASCEWRRKLTFRAVNAIEYVRFSPAITNNGLVLVCDEVPAFPPDSCSARWTPKESYLIDRTGPLEYWPSRTLLHFYYKPHDATTYQRVMRRIPQNLGDSYFSPGLDHEPGWGMYVRVGLDWNKFFWTCFSILALCLVPGLSWWMLRDDVQGGTGITSCLMGFVGLFIAARMSAR